LASSVAINTAAAIAKIAGCFAFCGYAGLDPFGCRCGPAAEAVTLDRWKVLAPVRKPTSVRVVVFAKGAAAEAAKAAGADYVGFDDLVKQCQGGWTDFDVAVATPEAMQEVRKLGKVLGPKGLMPNPKTGTVTDDTAKAVKEVKAGRVEFKMDKAANLHVAFGKLSFEPKAIEENARAVIGAIVHAKPPTAKGQFVQSCTLSSTMSPGLKIDMHEFASA